MAISAMLLCSQQWKQVILLGGKFIVNLAVRKSVSVFFFRLQKIIKFVEKKKSFKYISGLFTGLTNIPSY